MTSVTYGGGPTIEQRREFSGFQSGSHVPGYLGYCPQLKYRQGKTYGQDTHELSKDLSYYNGPKDLDTKLLESREVDGRVFTAHEKCHMRKIPLATGDNKYTERMVPGYTGYMPKMLYNFGGTYRELSDKCIDEFVRDFQSNEAKSAEVNQVASMFPKLRPRAGDPAIRDHLNFWADSTSKRATLMEDKRASVEPPIPGYKGFVPRVYNTELGLGCRYHEMTKKGLQSFYGDRSRERVLQSQMSGEVITRLPEKQTNRSFTAPAGDRRVYAHNGMIPKYTGYVPRQRFAFGNTYGDTTRAMPVCSHRDSSYGDHVKHLSARAECAM